MDIQTLFWVKEKIEKLSREEKQGLVWCLLVTAVVLAVILAGIVPANGYLRAADGGVLTSPLIKGVVAMLFLVAGLTGLAYGFAAGTSLLHSGVAGALSASIPIFS